MTKCVRESEKKHIHFHLRLKSVRSFSFKVLSTSSRRYKFERVFSFASFFIASSATFCLHCNMQRTQTLLHRRLIDLSGYQCACHSRSTRTLRTSFLSSGKMTFLLRARLFLLHHLFLFICHLVSQIYIDAEN